MFSKWLALAVLAGLPAMLQAETWEGATQRLADHAQQGRGRGAVVHLERLDARTVRIRLKAQWPGLRGASVQSSGEGLQDPRCLQIEGAPTDLVERTATIDPRATRVEVRLQGSDVNPKLMLRMPAMGQAEVGMVLIGSAPGA